MYAMYESVYVIALMFLHYCVYSCYVSMWIIFICRRTCP